MGELQKVTDLAETVCHRLKSMKTQRDLWVSKWQELADNFMPRKGTFNDWIAGQQNDDDIFSSTPTHALELLASALGGVLTNPSLKWLDLVEERTRGKAASRDVTKYLTDAREKMLDLFNSESTGFQSAAHELYLDLCLFGMGCMFVEDDADAFVRFSARPLSEIYVSENSRGLVDTVFRKYKMSARQISQQWPDKHSREVDDALKDDPEKEFWIIHAVFPRDDRDPLAKISTAKNMPVACVYLEENSKTILEESGYHEFPFMVPRWSKVAGEVYGRGPGLTALPAARVLHIATKDFLVASEKKTNPPLMVPDDGFLAGVNTNPGGLSYYRSGTTDRIEALPNVSDLGQAAKFIEYEDAQLRSMFLANQLDDAERPPMTATEALIKQGEKMKILAPVIGRMQTEFLTPLIKRVYGILERAKEFPTPPQAFNWRRVRVNHSGPLAKVQRASDAQNFQQAIEFLAPLIGKTDPLGIMQLFDGDVIARAAGDIFGLPPDYFKDDERISGERAEQKKMQQGAASDASLQNAANIANTAGNIGTTPDTLAGQLLGAGQQNTPPESEQAADVYGGM